VDERVLIAGGGTMGAGIASIAARSGYRVVIVEPNESVVGAARERIARAAQRAGTPEIVERIEFVTDVPAQSQAIVAIEAVPERIDIKRGVLERLSGSIDVTALLATNTSSLSVAELSAAVSRPERFLGLHFFNPPEAMQLIEIVPTDETNDDAIARATEFVQRLGKTGVFAADSPGFIVNRVARPYYLQSMRALASGVASAPELDALARGAGFRMGPFELMDLIGLDVNLATTESVYERTGEERLSPVPMQQQLVAAGSLGRKTGRGFYDYRDGTPERFEPEAQTGVEKNADETAVVIGFGSLADELALALEARFETVHVIGNDDLLDDFDTSCTIVFDAGDGVLDRKRMLMQLDSMLDPSTVIFCDAYTTDVGACASGLTHPERVVGFGVLGSFAEQRCVEIVDSEDVADDTLELAQDIFESLGKGVILVEDVAGLYLGRTIGSIVNEAMVAVQEGVGDPEGVDLAMRLGANYPQGPVVWGREIGGRRIARILERVAAAEGSEFAPDRSLWLLDLQDEQSEAPGAAAESTLPGLTQG
jgi:3-hydroxybutyryl-CoA dehydrogenase